MRLPPKAALLADAQLLNDGAIPFDILLHQVIEQIAAVTNHLQKAAAGMVVLLVYLQVFGQIVDSLGENGDLDLGRTAALQLICGEENGQAVPSVKRKRSLGVQPKIWRSASMFFRLMERTWLSRIR